MSTPTKEEIFKEIQAIFVEKFDLEESRITPDAHLYEQLDLDSIDLFDLLVLFEKRTGKNLSLDDFKKATTVSGLVDQLHAVL